MLKIALPLQFIAFIAFLLTAGCNEPRADAQTSSQTSSKPAVSPTVDVNDALIEWFDKAIIRVDDMTPAAEAVADKLLAGGCILTAGNSGFGEEMFFRVGGFPFVKPWVGSGHAPGKDVFLYGRVTPNDPVANYERFTTLMSGGRFKNNIAVVFTSKQWPQVSRILNIVPSENYEKRVFLIDMDVPASGSIKDTCLSQVAAIALGWAFQGEVIAAVTRKGKMLATYSSEYEPPPLQTDDAVKDMIINPNYDVPPVAAGVLGRAYLTACRDQLAQFKKDEAHSMSAAADQMVRCFDRGGMAWAVLHGHIHQGATQMPQQLPILKFGREFDWEKYYLSKMPKGDLLVWLGYVEYPEKQTLGALQSGCDVIAVSSLEGQARPGVTNIKAPYGSIDACVSVPGYPLHVLPTSGVVQSAIWYSLMAELEQKLSAR